MPVNLKYKYILKHDLNYILVYTFILKTKPNPLKKNKLLG